MTANSHHSASAASADGLAYVGVDVGGTNIKLGLVSDDGSPLAKSSIPTEPDRGPHDAARRIAAAVKLLLKQVPGASAPRVGLVTPGPMDIPNGMLLCPGNLPAWHNTPIRDLVSEACGLPVTYANDANAAAYGEYWGGAGRGCRSLAMFTLGTGVGGGLITDGLLIEGLHGCGGELGHVIIDHADDAPLNTLGVRGTLEGFCGSYALVRRAEEALAAGDASYLRAQRDAGEPLTPKLIAEAASAGDLLAYDLVMSTARYLAFGVVAAIHTIDPERVVLGGAMTFGGAGHPLGEKFLARVRQEADRRLIPSIRGKIEIEFASLGSDAGVIGAAGLARREHLCGAR